jgi:capsular exopolysaccharide synthesis family protein
MSKTLLAILKARNEGKREPALNEKVTDLLVREHPTIDNGNNTLRRTRVRAKQGASDSAMARGRQGDIDEYLVAFHRSNAPAAEQYRKLYTEIVRAGRTRELRTLLIASALAGEGKTVTALNLATTIAASSSGWSTLLVDMDLRKPHVHRLLGTHPACGLTDYLLGDVACSRIFATTQIPGLTVVYGGRPVRDPTRLFSAEKIEHFFHEIKSQEQYRYIVLDTSPVLLTAETNVLIHHADATILVVRAGKTPRDVVSQAIETLGMENILGCVFNGITSADVFYYDYYYNSDYYHTKNST